MGYPGSIEILKMITGPIKDKFAYYLGEIFNFIADD